MPTTTIESDLAHVPEAMGDLLVRMSHLVRLQTLEEVSKTLKLQRAMTGGLACDGLDRAIESVRAFQVEAEAEYRASQKGEG